MLKPKQLILEPTNRCNLQCLDCPSVCNNGRYPVGDMDLDFFKAMVDRAAEEFPDTVIVPWGYGESFLHPQYLEMIKYLNEKGRKFYVTTNGTIWREEIFRELFRHGSGAYQLIVSIDGMFGTGSIEKARPGTNEAQLHTNINRILRLHGEMDSKTDLAVKICERGQDYEEIENFVQYWLEESEIDFVCVGKILKGDNEVPMRVYPCQYFDNNFMFVRFDGALIPCTYNDHVINEGLLKYGHMRAGDSLIEAYNNPFIQKLRDDQKAGIFPSPCDRCPIAYSGVGIHGKIGFRNDPAQEYFYQKDYYNTIYSRVQKWKPNSYYGGVDAPKGD